MANSKTIKGRSWLKPARTVMATMSSSSREAMILPHTDGKYRLPTVREAACMMSFPMDYWFYGETKAVKHMLVGNAVPPKMSFAIAKSILECENKRVPLKYLPIKHDKTNSFVNLNGMQFPLKKERPKRLSSKFKYHIPYLIVKSYRVELTNYRSDFEGKHFIWDGEIHYSQGKLHAKIYKPDIHLSDIPEIYHMPIEKFLNQVSNIVPSMEIMQYTYCMTKEERERNVLLGPYEMLNRIRAFIDLHIPVEKFTEMITLENFFYDLPLPIAVGYYIVLNLISKMEG